MFTTKTSIYALTLAAGLAIGFAPGTSFAQSAGAATAGQNIADYVGKQSSDINTLAKQFPSGGGNATPAPAPAPQPGPSASSGTSGFVTPAPAPVVPEMSWWESIKLKAKLMAIMLSSALSSKEEPKTPPKTETPKTAEAPHTTSKAALVIESKALELKTTAVKTETAAAPKLPVKLVLPEVQKPTELNLNTVDPLKLTFREQAETQPLKLVLPETKKAELNLNTVKAQAEIVTPKSTPAGTAPRAAVTTVARLDVSRPTVNVAATVARPTITIARPAINVPHPVVNVPRINIPVVAIRR